MKALVIGGCGFIGSHVVDRLLAEGCGVRVLDRRPEAFRAPLPGVEYIQGDLNDSAQLYEALSGMDAVLHLASTTVPATSNLDPVSDVSGNLVSALKLLEGMRASGVRKLVYLSSGGTVYGVPRCDPVPEDHPLNPISSYGVVKVAVENYLFMERQLHGLDYVVLRASNPYGPRQGHTGIQGVIGTCLWRLARREQIEVWGDGSIVRDFLHVRDLAGLCYLALQSDRSGIYNAGRGEGTSVAEVIDRIRATVAADSPDIELRQIHRPGRNFDVPRVVLDIGRARRELGWAPEIPLSEGLAQTWTWVRSTGIAEGGGR